MDELKILINISVLVQIFWSVCLHEKNSGNF